MEKKTGEYVAIKRIVLHVEQCMRKEEDQPVSGLRSEKSESCRPMFAVHASTGSIETSNCGEHGKPWGVTERPASSMLIRVVQGNRRSLCEPLNFDR